MQQITPLPYTSIYNLCSGIAEWKGSFWRHFEDTVVKLSLCLSAYILLQMISMVYSASVFIFTVFFLYVMSSEFLLHLCCFNLINNNNNIQQPGTDIIYTYTNYIIYNLKYVLWNVASAP